MSYCNVVVVPIAIKIELKSSKLSLCTQCCTEIVLKPNHRRKTNWISCRMGLSNFVWHTVVVNKSRRFAITSFLVVLSNEKVLALYISNSLCTILSCQNSILILLRNHAGTKIPISFSMINERSHCGTRFTSKY